jgi:succinyl-CoA synthetase beta subunit
MRHAHPRLVVRLAGTDLELAKERLAAVQVLLVENLDEAVEQTVRLAKVPAKR